MDGRGYPDSYADMDLLPWFFGWEAVKSYQNTRSWTIGVLRASARRIPIRRQSGGVVQVKQDTALELYHLTGKQFYKDFLKKSKNSIIKRYFDRGQEKEIIDFLQFGFFASSSLDKFRKIADEREMSILSAYILEEQKKKAPKTTTKFTIWFTI